MKAFTIASLALAGLSSVAAVAMEPRSTPAPIVKRQDGGDAVGAITGLLNPLTGYLTNSGVASLVQSLASNPEFLSAAQAAGTSDYAPIVTLISSLQANTEVSSVIYEALGTTSASEFYASASAAAARLEEAGTRTRDEASSSASVIASSIASSLSSVAPPANAAAPVYNPGTLLPAALAVVGVAAGAILL